MKFEFIEDEAVREKAVEAYNESIETINNGIGAKIDEAVAGLKSKNEELLDEKKKIAETLKNFENIDPEKAKDALKFLENNEDAQLIKDGRVDELIDKRTSTLRQEHEAALNELMEKFEAASTEGTTFKGLYQTKVIEDSLRDAALTAKVRPEALADILLRGRSVFSLAEDGSVESRGSDGKLAKTDDDKVLTPTNWIDGLKVSSPHYWPGSSGAGARGGAGGDEGDITAALNRAAASGNMTEYRRLRAKQK